MSTPRHLPAPGFTLIELMITVAVAAVLTMVALPSFYNFLQNTRRNSTIDSLVTTLNYTRNQALNLDQTTSLCAIAADADTTNVNCSGNTWTNGWQVVTTPNGSQTPTALASRVIAITSVTPTITAANGSAQLQFSGQGLVQFQGATGSATSELFTVCDARGATSARAVVVNATGYIQTSPTPGLAPDGTTVLACP